MRVWTEVLREQVVVSKGKVLADGEVPPSSVGSNATEFTRIIKCGIREMHPRETTIDNILTPRHNMLNKLGVFLPPLLSHEYVVYARYTFMVRHQHRLCSPLFYLVS